MVAHYVVSSASLDEVDAWYRRVLPPATRWQKWTPCSTQSVEANQRQFPNQGTERIWVYPGMMLTLDTSGPKKGPVIIFLDEAIGVGALGGVCPPTHA
jgi:hypothetical protein